MLVSTLRSNILYFKNNRSNYEIMKSYVGQKPL